MRGIKHPSFEKKRVGLFVSQGGLLLYMNINAIYP